MKKLLLLVLYLMACNTETIVSQVDTTRSDTTYTGGLVVEVSEPVGEDMNRFRRLYDPDLKVICYSLNGVFCFKESELR